MKTEKPKNPHISPEWPGTLHRKIDIYLNGVYWASSNAYKNTRAAKLGVMHELGVTGKAVQAIYADE